MRTFLSILVLLGLGGCAEWEELPDDATGFLAVSRVHLDGQLRGLDLSAGTVIRETGYCTPRGFSVELATEVDELVVQNTLEVRDLFWTPGDAVNARFVEATEGAPLIAETDASAEADVVGCVGSRLDAWDFEDRASVAILDIERVSEGRERVYFQATYGEEQVSGSFDMNMPVTD